MAFFVRIRGEGHEKEIVIEQGEGNVKKLNNFINIY